MAHASRRLSSIADVLKGGTVALQRGLPYARLLEKKYGFGNVRIVPSPGGDISAFLGDESFAQQCFIVSEPLAAKRRGVAVTVFPVADVGYNPYTTVLATSGDFLRKNADTAKRMVDATREGWRAYLADPKPTNERMRQLNPSMDAQTYADVAEAQKPLIDTDDTRRDGLGTMSKRRWTDLSNQLKELGDIAQVPDASEYFRLL
jgi:NitT/TauT family transport system substrate-binding protein